MKVITVTNQKGGVGKTTTSVNLAAGLAECGKDVLVIDLDPQAQAGTVLGLGPEQGAFYLLTMVPSPQTSTFMRQWIRQTGREHLWLIAGSQEIMAAQTVLNAQNKPVSHIRETITPFVKSSLDYIIFDTAPSVGGIQERAIWASDLVIVPTSTEYLGLDGVNKVSAMMVMLQQEKNWRGSLLGVLPTFYDETRESKAAMDDLKLGFGDRALQPIHRATILRECAAEGKTIFEKDSKSRAAAEYQQLVQTVLKY